MTRSIWNVRDDYGAVGLVSNGTVTTFRTVRVRKGQVSGGGAIGTNVGVEIEAITGGTTNYAIRCAGGQVNLSLPGSPVGLTAGSLWSNAGVVTVA